MMKRLVTFFAWGILFACLTTAVHAASHVRVILDVSGSMRTNDPDQQVILATLLLHDLAAPNTTLGDTFKVLPFEIEARTDDGSWEWKDPADPVPVSRRDWIEAQTNHRDEFVNRLAQQQYDSVRTFFYPGLLRSIDDIENVSQAKDDVKVIVLVTDGAPEPGTRDKEAELIRRDLVPRLERLGIRLYVLAFSNEAYGNVAFFDAMLKASGASQGGGGGQNSMSGNPVPLGDHFIDATSQKLLDNMLEIFGRSFGYSPDQAQQLPGVTQLDLEKGFNPERVAVVVLSKRLDPPRLSLSPPPGGLLNNPGGLLQATEDCGSYALRWVLVPDQGPYGFDTDVHQGSVAVLRPTRLELKVEPVPPHSIDRTMAQTRLPLRVLVRPASGAGVDPGQITLSFQPFGPRNTEPDGDPYLWQGEEDGALSSTGTLTPEGRLYEIEVEFPANQEDATLRYGGFLEVEARRREALVGSLRGTFAHRVEVHPRLEIITSPSAELAAPTALEAGEGGCVKFSLELKSQDYQLPPGKADYGLRAVLDLSDPSWENQELREATFTLDGRGLQFEGKPGQNPGEWYKGRKLPADELLGQHELCVVLGDPTRGDPATPLGLPLRFTLQESPYDEFDVVEPFTLRIPIAPPTFLDKWSAWILTGLTLLLLLLALWYLRDRPTFPDDLRYAVARENAAAGLMPQPLPDGSVVARLLGLVVERPIKVPGDSRNLGWVRPVDDELYRLRPARDVQVEATEPGTRLERHGKLTDLEAHQTYRLKSGGGAYLFRMEYQ